MYYRDGIVALARSVDDSPPEWRWAWEGFVGAYVPALSHTPVGGFEPPVPWQPAASKMPDGAYMQDATGGAGFVCRMTPAGKAARARYTTEEWTVAGVVRARANPSNNQYVSALVPNNTDADPYVTAGIYANAAGDIYLAQTDSLGAFQSTPSGVSLDLNRMRSYVAQKRGTGNAAVLHRDGELIDEALTLVRIAGTGNVSTTGGLCVGSGAVNAREFDAEIYVSAIWGRSFTNGEASRISAHPIAMFRWQRRRAYSFSVTSVTTIRPSADVTDGGWLNEAASNTNLYASVDDNPTVDTTYIQSPLTASANAVTLALASPGGTPGAGALTLTVRLKRIPL